MVQERRVEACSPDPLPTYRSTENLGDCSGSYQSGREDSNLRPLDPQSSALTRLRYAPGPSRSNSWRNSLWRTSSKEECDAAEPTPTLAVEQAPLPSCVSRPHDGVVRARSHFADASLGRLWPLAKRSTPMLGISATDRGGITRWSPACVVRNFEHRSATGSVTIGGTMTTTATRGLLPAITRVIRQGARRP